jgi:hypothetical protein
MRDIFLALMLLVPAAIEPRVADMLRGIPGAGGFLKRLYVERAAQRPGIIASIFLT